MPLHSALKHALTPEVPDALVFADRSSWSQRLRRDLLRAGQPDTHDGHAITVHAMRRSFLTFLTNNAVPPEVVKRLGGHSQGVTESNYINRDFEQLRAAVEMMKLF